MGILFTTWLAVRTGVAVLPSGVSWPMIYALTWLCAIGFTMALFIAGLAFTDPATMDVAKIAILAASTVAGVAGMVLVKKSTRRK